MGLGTAGWNEQSFVLSLSGNHWQTVLSVPPVLDQVRLKAHVPVGESFLLCQGFSALVGLDFFIMAAVLCVIGW